jgi:uncharacterized protein
MAADNGPRRELRNETAVNVAGLLKAQVGAARSYDLVLDALVADDETVARDVAGVVKLTRLRDGVMAHATAEGLATLICARCLREYEQPFALELDEEYRQTVDVRTGADLDFAFDLEDDEQVSRIDENHELDLREPLRQEILVSLPMRPDCGEECPGPDVLEAGAADEDSEVVDDRLAALASLLGDERGNTSG